MRELNDYLVYNRGEKVNLDEHSKRHSPEGRYFDILNKNMIAKSKKRVEDIQKRILHDISNNIFDKKYQVSGFFEYKELNNFCKTIDTKGRSLQYSFSKDEMKNSLDRIVIGYYDNISETPFRIYNKKVNVLYCCFTEAQCSQDK